MRALATVACVVAAIAALWLSFLAVGDLCLTGFPDGHLTDYDKAVDAPKRVLMWLEFGFVPLFLVLAFARHPGACRRLLAALVVFGLVVVVQLVGVPWYLEVISVSITESVARRAVRWAPIPWNAVFWRSRWGRFSAARRRRDGNPLPARRQGRQVEHELSAFVAFEVGGELAPSAECRVLEILERCAIGAGRSCDANDVGAQVGQHHHGVGHWSDGPDLHDFEADQRAGAGHRRSARPTVRPSAWRSTVPTVWGASRRTCFMTLPTSLRGSCETTST